jgi:transposase
VGAQGASPWAEAHEAALDGIYVVGTSLPATVLDDASMVGSYKSLSLVERAFRCLKTVDLQIRPVYHWLAERVRAHVFVCMLAYYLEWHMRQPLAPMLSMTIPTRRVAEAQCASAGYNLPPETECISATSEIFPVYSGFTGNFIDSDLFNPKGTARIPIN